MTISRIARLRRILDENELDLALIYSTCNDARFFRWITGQTCRSGSNYLWIDRLSLGWLELSYHLPDLPTLSSATVRLVEEIDEIPAALADLTKTATRVGLIGDAPFWHLNQVTSRILALKDQGDELLWIKSSQEIDEITRLGARLVDDIEQTARQARQGDSEYALAELLRVRLHAHGGKEAFPTSVVSGDRLKITTLGAPTTRELSFPDAICIDCGIESGGIFSDCTRMYFLGDSPLASFYERLRVVQEAVVAQIVPGMIFGSIASLFDTELALHGFVGHNLKLSELGHGIGFALHETPFLMNKASEEVQIIPGMVFTLEPEITVEGHQIRVEDMVAITTTGAKILTP